MATLGMVRTGPSGAGAFIIIIIIIISTVASRAQKGDGCGNTFLGPSSGTLSSINYPQTYPNHTVCEWEIRVPPQKRVHFKFGDFDIEDSDCHFNYLRIYNGIGTNRAEIVKYCGLGLQLPELIQSSGNEVTIQFMSGVHKSGRGFFLSYSTTAHTDMITCLDKGINFTEPEFSKFCPAGCQAVFGEISGTIPHGYRDSSSVCLAAIHAGVVSNTLGGQVNVVSSKGIPYYESTLANNVTSTSGLLSNSLLPFKTNGCYGTLGLKAGVVRESQISASSMWEWSDTIGGPSVWGPPGARLKKAGLPWAAAHSDQHQWLQVDLKREMRITGITTTGSTLMEFPFYVSAYRILYSQNGRNWQPFREPDIDRDKVFQGNTNYLQEVRNNFIPPIEARFVRMSPTQWQERIAVKLELLGCLSLTSEGPARRGPQTVWPRVSRPSPPKLSTNPPLQSDKTTLTPDIRNTTITPSINKDVALAAVLIPSLAMALSALVLALVCTWHWRNRKKSTEGVYDLPQWDRTGWWKGMKQLLPSKMAEGEDSVVRYSNTEVGRLRGRQGAPVLLTEPAEYAQPLASGVVGTLGQRYPDSDQYDAPLTDIYHAYAEPLPASGAEYATPIVLDIASYPTSGPIGQQPSVSSFKGCGTTPLLARKDSNQSGASPQYDTPKHMLGQAPPKKQLEYQVPQNSAQKGSAKT
ncbi:discoidin, CUB and LCCL domain-containing protein 2 [Conger conger]|uniref:discoidin, CUB and LCCL domain-containing protein 2 n=1 Tax=Conger conger TaxID=82655 RepID=UPI002A5A0C90|nr:discoidin, CUB and LCCL domain-containing protein 2 [Conger conger]